MRGTYTNRHPFTDSIPRSSVFVCTKTLKLNNCFVFWLILCSISKTNEINDAETKSKNKNENNGGGTKKKLPIGNDAISFNSFFCVLC